MISYIIVDDETAAHDNIEDYAQNLPQLQLKKNCYNAFEAIEYLQQHPVDLLFLDINMPKLSGFDFLRLLPNPPKVIVTTAYKEFALEGYELNIDDYLLKPFGLDRFLAAVNKVSGSLSENQQKPASEEGSIFIKDQKKFYQIKLEDVLYAEAYGNYVKVHSTDKTYLTHQTLASLEQSLPDQQFIKVHKSYVVAIKKIELVEGNMVFVAGVSIPIGKVHKEGVDRLLGRG